MRCWSCEVEYPEGVAACPACGVPLWLRQAAERRQITVLFSELMGLKELFGALDPEELRDITREYVEIASAVARRWQGFVAQCLQDGILVYFGYPTAREDAAKDAVRAGLEIVRAVPQARFNSRNFHARVGVHTGVVVVGAVGVDGRVSQLALGEVPNLAHRAQSAAPAGAVVVTDSTRRLLGRSFDCGRLDNPVTQLHQTTAFFQLLGERTVSTRFYSSAGELIPFVGRHTEVSILTEAWTQAQKHAARIVAVRGEPGVGKSRLIENVKCHVSPDRHWVADCQCSPYHENSAFYPIIDLMERVFELRTATDDVEKLRRLEEGLSRFTPCSPQELATVATLLSVTLPAGRATLDTGPQKQRQRTIETLIELLANAARVRPVMLIVEDLQWADPSTLELLRSFIEAPSLEGVLLICSYRAEFVPAWDVSSGLQEVTLAPLDDLEVKVLATNVARRKLLPATVMEQIVERSAGIPLFVEEITKAILEAGVLREHADHYESTGLQSTVVPPSTQDLLAARLDRVGEAKPTAQLAAAIGREFSYDLLAAVSGKSQASLQADIEALIRAELVQGKGTPPYTSYVFKHALIRDAAYASLLRRTSQQYHRQIAYTLRAAFAQIVEAQPDLMGLHYERGGMTAEAVAAWAAAGARSLLRAANNEARAHFTRALELLKRLSAGPERDARELEIQAGLGPALMATRGWQDRDAREACHRAFELCRRGGDHARAFPMLWGIWANHFVGGDYAAAIDTASSIGELARVEAPHPDRQELAHHALGFTLYFHGDLASAASHAAQGAALFDRAREARLVQQLQLSPMVALRLFGASSWWLLGESDKAARCLDETWQLLAELNHAPSEAFALSAASWLACLQGDASRTRELAQAALHLAEEHGFSLWSVVEGFYFGWANAAQGDVAAGIGRMRHSVAEYRRLVPTGLLLGQMHAALAETLLRTSRITDAMAMADEGLVHIERSQWRYVEPELHRVRGECLAAAAQSPGGPRLADAEDAILRAIDRAMASGAVALERRARQSLMQFASTHALQRGSVDQTSRSTM